MKHIIKRNNSDYIINCDAQGNGGYNVVPREIDIHNKYTLEEVELYLAEHPDMLIDSAQIEAEEIRNNEIASLKAYLSSTDYIYPKCLELGLDVNVEYAEVVAERKTARAKIQELEGV